MHDAKTLAAETVRGNFVAITSDQPQLANFHTEIYEDDYKGLLIALCNQNGNYPWQAKAILEGLNGGRERTQFVADLVARAESAEAKLSALQEEVGRLREALEPFADYASQDGFGLDYHGRELPDGDGPGWVYVTNGDFRRARSALARTAGGKDD